MAVRKWGWLGVLALTTGCNALLDIDHIEFGDAGGANGTGAASTAASGGAATTGAGGGERCAAGTTQPCYDGPAQHAGVGICAVGVSTCSAETWGPCEGWVAAQPEACDGVLDDDCDGSVDEGCACADGTTMTCGTDVGACETGTQICAMGAWGMCSGGTEPTTENCDNDRDDDCDGATDCADATCATHPACTGTCGNGVCDLGENDVSCPCDCSGCVNDNDCNVSKPQCCIPCGCGGPALQCVTVQDCCG
jgi:hypothetical protein